MKKKFSPFTLFLFLSLFTFINNSAFAHATHPKDTTSQQPSVLFIQVAKQGQFIAKPNEPGNYTLVLKKVDDFTSYFTDRPRRITSIIPIRQYIKLWQTEDIKTNPPNVALESTNLKNGQRINRILVLSHPSYDARKNTMSYDAKVLNDPAQSINQMQLGYTVLFIDDFHWNGSQVG